VVNFSIIFPTNLQISSTIHWYLLSNGKRGCPQGKSRTISPGLTRKITQAGDFLQTAEGKMEDRMSRGSRGGSIVLRILAAVLLVGILVGGAVWIYQAGFTQGAVQAQMTGENAPQFQPGLPYSPWGYARPHFGFFPFFPLFGFFLFGLFFLFLLRWAFRPWHWGYGGSWHRHPHPEGTPPWEKDRPAEEKTAKEGEQE
jgi:hypothetical protein